MASKIDNGDYVREYYQVPAHKGRSVLWRGRPARILGFDLAYLRIELLDIDPLSNEESKIVVHPTWEVQYPPLTEEEEHAPKPAQEENETAQQWNQTHCAA